jgi:hypothetical protein
MEVRANTKTELASLLSAAVHAQSAWVKLCETQTAKVKNKEGGGERKRAQHLPDAL